MASLSMLLALQWELGACISQPRLGEREEMGRDGEGWGGMKRDAQRADGARGGLQLLPEDVPSVLGVKLWQPQPSPEVSAVGYSE